MLVVVLPTPPFWFTMAIVLIIGVRYSLCFLFAKIPQMYEIRVFFPYYSAVIVDKSGFLLITSPEISPFKGSGGGVFCVVCQ